MRFMEGITTLTIEIEEEDNPAEIGLMRSTIDGLRRTLELYRDAKQLKED